MLNLMVIQSATSILLFMGLKLMVKIFIRIAYNSAKLELVNISIQTPKMCQNERRWLRFCVAYGMEDHKAPHTADKQTKSLILKSNRMFSRCELQLLPHLVCLDSIFMGDTTGKWKRRGVSKVIQGILSEPYIFSGIYLHWLSCT